MKKSNLRTKISRARSRQKAQIAMANAENRRPRVFKIFTFTESILNQFGYELEDCIITSRLGELQKNLILRARAKARYDKSKALPPGNLSEVRVRLKKNLNTSSDLDVLNANKLIAKRYFQTLSAQQLQELELESEEESKEGANPPSKLSTNTLRSPSILSKLERYKQTLSLYKQRREVHKHD